MMEQTLLSKPERSPSLTIQGSPQRPSGTTDALRPRRSLLLGDGKGATCVRREQAKL